ncbi:MAG: ABC transporter permease [bacterium]|nr:ABC transporter permease [bacterium]
MLRSLARNQRLLKDFVVRDLKARYVGSSMGFFWSVVFPIINLCVYMFVFRLVLKARWSDSQGPLEVALVMLAGIVVWAAFAETVSRATNSLVENSNLIQKVVFPSELLPVYLTISSLINMCIGLPVVVLCVVWFAYVAPPDVHVLIEHDKVTEQPLRLVSPEGGTELAVPIFLSRGLDRDVRVQIELDGTAEPGVDYADPVRELVIPSGQLRVDVLIFPLHDMDDQEGEETIIVRLAAAENANLIKKRSKDGRMDRHQTAYITDADPSDAVREVASTFLPQQDIDPHYSPLKLGPSMLFLPVLFFLQILFTVGIGCFLATLNLYLRDTFHLVGVGITVWMFSTPIFYPADMVERAGLGLMLKVNPMHWLIDSYRDVLLFSRWPNPVNITLLFVVGLCVFWVGSKFFMSQKARFPDLL